jgi:hemerythrin superfamily protein
MRKFKVLEVNNIIEDVIGMINCTKSSYTESCVVQDLETGEIISVNKKTANGLTLNILNKVDDNDCIVGDHFRIK